MPACSRVNAPAAASPPAQDVRLWPLRVESARYQAHVTDVPAPALALGGNPRACMRLKFKVTAALKANQLSLDRLDLYLAGDEGVAHRVYEQLFANCTAVVVQNTAKRNPKFEVLRATALQPGGLSDDEALLPVSPRAFGGYRLIKEYAAFPERFLFAQVNGPQRRAAASGYRRVRAAVRARTVSIRRSKRRSMPAALPSIAHRPSTCLPSGPTASRSTGATTNCT